MLGTMHSKVMLLDVPTLLYIWYFGGIMVCAFEAIYNCPYTFLPTIPFKQGKLAPTFKS